MDTKRQLQGLEPQILPVREPGNLSDSDTAALMDTNSHSPGEEGDLGIDNVGLDFHDLDFIMDENSQKLLNGILPESPPDSSSEHCLASPNYYSGGSILLSPPELTLGDQDLEYSEVSPVYISGETISPLYSDPVLSGSYNLGNSPPGGSLSLHHSSIHHRLSQLSTEGQVPDLCTVDYSQPLQLVEQLEQQLEEQQGGRSHAHKDNNIQQSTYAKSNATTLPPRLIQHQAGQIVTIPVRNQQLNTPVTVRAHGNNGIQRMNSLNNNSSVSYPNPSEISRSSSITQLNPRGDYVVPVTVQDTIKQEPLCSPPQIDTLVEESETFKGTHRKKRRRDAPDAPPVSVEIKESVEKGNIQSVRIKSESQEVGETGINVQFLPFMPTFCSTCYSSDLSQCSTPILKVSADKGFNWSQTDEAFIAQKKNHFQLTCNVVKEGSLGFVETEAGYKQVEYLQLNFYGVKKEAPDQRIQIEQSQTDRSRKRFYPIKLSFRGEQPMRVSVGRLHFSETTLNNMRKKGRPNPEQRFFQLVVSLEAVVTIGLTRREVNLSSMATERIIVRASNPGLFEPEQEFSWCKQGSGDTVYHLGKVGIGTDQSTEALTVQGNIQVSGQVLHPSDSRIKNNITRVDPKKQLENVQKIQVVEYQYRPEYLERFPQEVQNVMNRKQTGVIAQDLKKIIPDAVESAGDLFLPSGNKVDGMLIVNKDRLFLENIGAVHALSKVTDSLGHRIEELESHTVKMSRLNRFGSVNSSASLSTNSSYSKSSTGKRRSRGEGSIFRNRWIQGAILVLVGIMTMCLLAMAILYILKYQREVRKDPDFLSGTLRPNTTLSTFTETLPHEGVLITKSHNPKELSTKKDKITTIITNLTTIIESIVTTVKPTLGPARRRIAIGRPHNCPESPETERPCNSKCCSQESTKLNLDVDNVITGTGPDVRLDVDSNNISAPGALDPEETQTLDNISDTAGARAQDNNVIEENLLTGPEAVNDQNEIINSQARERLGDSVDRGPEDLDIIVTSEENIFRGDNEDNEVITAVRREAHYDDNSEDSYLQLPGAGSHQFDFLSDPRSDEQDPLHKNRFIIGEISRNHEEKTKSLQDIKRKDLTLINQIIVTERAKEELRAIQENIANIDKVAIIKYDTGNNQDESSFQSKDSGNVTSEEEDFGEEDRSSLFGRKSGKSTGTSSNNLFDTETKHDLKKSVLESPIISEKDNKIPEDDSVGSGVNVIREKRNVPQENEDLHEGNRADEIKELMEEPSQSGCGKVAKTIQAKTAAGTVTLGPEYCDDCQSSAGYICSYSVPLSRYMPDHNVTLIFSSEATKCPIAHHTPIPCPASDIGVQPSNLFTLPERSSTNIDPQGSSGLLRMSLDVRTYSEEYHRFRLRMNPSDSTSRMCDLGGQEAGKSYVEIIVRLYRLCDE